MYTFQFFDLGWIKRMFFTEEEEDTKEESCDELLERLEKEYDKKDSSD